MTGRDYFILGSKLFGVYCLFLSIPAFLAIIPTFVQMNQRPIIADLDKIYMAQVIAIRIIPIVYISIGIYLIKGADHLCRFAYPYDSEMSMDNGDKFTLFAKMLGIFLIVNYFPDLLRAISGWFAYSNSNAFKIFKFFIQDQRNTYLDAASSIWGVGFGFYLLISGELIARLVLESAKSH